MNRKYIEKLIIAIIIFVGVSTITGSAIGSFVKVKKEADDKKKNSLILETINLNNFSSSSTIGSN